VPDRGALGRRAGRYARTCIVVALALLPAGLALAEASPAAVMRGGWVATAGAGQVFRGRWSAQILPAGPNVAQGSWTLLGQGDEIALEGTWLARKAPRGWRGTWAARTQDGGQTFSGSWEAQTRDLQGKTFEDLLKRTAQKQIAGAWHSGRARGSWWLKG
jgi:hypothetical protein